MGTVDHDADAIVEQGRFEALPARVQEALGELAGAVKEGLLALSVGFGLGVLAELMDEEVCEVVGPKGRHDPDRSAVRSRPRGRRDHARRPARRRRPPARQGGGWVG